MEDAEFLAPPKFPAPFDIPASSSTVKVRVIDTGMRLEIRADVFLEPKLDGFRGIFTPSYCFLISHREGEDEEGNARERHVLFDLGVRRDWESYAPKIVDLVRATTTVKRGPNVAAVLDAAAGSSPHVAAADVSAIIWSHSHFDHCGDPATFPPATELVVGPGVRAASWPGWPSDPDGAVLDSDAAGRRVREISFDGNGNGNDGDGEGNGGGALRFGRFRAHDFFGDGSFYLLDAPGHATGHLCGLARTTADPPSFVLMGADACHHPGVLRPTEYLPLPRFPGDDGSSNGNGTEGMGPVLPCPGELLLRLKPDKTADEPFFTLRKGPYLLDHGAAMDTVAKIQELDARDDVFVVIAHDLSLRDRMPLFPETVNGWRAMDLGSKTRWLFCDDFKDALREAKEAKETKSRGCCAPVVSLFKGFGSLFRKCFRPFGRKKQGKALQEDGADSTV